MRSAVHNTAHWLRRRAELRAHREALVDGETRLDGEQLEALCQRAAGFLRASGVAPGDRVALLLANRAEYLALVFGAARLGAVAVPLNTRLAPPEIADLLDDCRPTVLVHEADLAEGARRALDQARHEPRQVVATGAPLQDALASATPHADVLPLSGEEPMILMYTSGTTGTPKGALLPHRKTLYNSLNAQLFFGQTQEDRVLVVVPLFHSFGLKILALPTLYSGGAVVLARHFDPDSMLDTLEREHITFAGGVPTMFRALDERLAAPPTDRDLSQLRFLFTAGAAIPVDLIHAFEARGIRLKQGFGQTETSILCCLDAADAVRKAGTVGRPVIHAEVKIVRTAGLEGPPDTWETCASGETGEIVVRGPITMLGYWERPEATAETIREGWLRTGDLASRDDEGFVTLTGRARDMYISGGENVYPRQVEEVYETHPALREVAVVGVADPRWGEVGCAFVVTHDGAPADGPSLAAWGRERLATFKVPQHFVTVGSLPRTASGKVQKHRLPPPPDAA